MRTWLFVSLWVVGLGRLHAVDFETEILPVLTKAGCNAGACHGAAAGRGGFRLSLLGADPGSDYDALVHEFEGRRTNPSQPELSLVLTKPTGQLDHGGDVALEETGEGARRLLEWIREGTPRGQSRTLVELNVEPKLYVASGHPATVPLKIIARFDDGEPKDVTQWTAFTSSDHDAVVVEETRDGVVAHLKRSGQHALIARFLDRVVPIQFNVPFSDKPIDLSVEARENFIDEEILRVLSELRIPVSPAASDLEWIRRVTLDLVGRLPKPSDIRDFQGVEATLRRPAYVKKLLASDAFNDYWTLRFSKLLRMHSLPNDKTGLLVYSDWLRSQIGQGVGFDRIAHELITATGDSHWVGAANFPRMVSDAREHAELVGTVFLGSQIGCANCHNHPLDKWTQDDYHGLAAIFAKLDRGRDVRLLSRGAVTNLRNNEPAIPRIPGTRNLEREGDHRLALAEWVTSENHRYFARATVNRLWKALFGRGLVEPTDDLRESNAPTHPELLARLADDFVEHGYSLRRTLGLIVLSNTYARSQATFEGNASDDRFYSHAVSRPLMPEVIVDAIADVTGVVGRYVGQSSDARAVRVIDPLEPVPSLDFLGRCSRGKGCDESDSKGGGLPAQLHLLNGELINAKLVNPEGRLHQMIVVGKTDEEVIREFYLFSLSRNPTDSETRYWCERISDLDRGKRVHKLEDFVWSLLNSRSFLENH